MIHIEKQVMDILRELYMVSGFRVSLYDSFRNQICVWPEELSPFCSMLQKSKEALNRCHDFDCEAFNHAQRTGEVYIYKCHCGLHEAVAPLYNSGVLSGFLMMGQVADSDRVAESEAIERAAAYVDDRGMIKRTVRGVTVRNWEQINSCVSIMKICAGHISRTSRVPAERGGLTDHVQAYLKLYYRESITLDTICREFYCSRASLTSSFRKSCGQSVIEYLTRVRMEKGMELLLGTDRRVGEIAESCGFSDQNYFCKVFKKHYGITPGKARESAVLSVASVREGEE